MLNLDQREINLIVDRDQFHIFDLHSLESSICLRQPNSCAQICFALHNMCIRDCISLWTDDDSRTESRRSRNFYDSGTNDLGVFTGRKLWKIVGGRKKRILCPLDLRDALCVLYFSDICHFENEDIWSNIQPNATVASLDDFAFNASTTLENNNIRRLLRFDIVSKGESRTEHKSGKGDRNWLGHNLGLRW